MTRIASCVTLCLVLIVGAAACGKKTPDPVPVPPPTSKPSTAPTAPPSPPPPPSPPAPTATPATLTDDEIFSRKTLEQLNAERPLGDVFFNLDEATIRDDARGPLQKNAEWLKRWSTTRIQVEGHCDERGTAEYNLALGERRANAVKQYLVSLGIAGERIAVVSKGKEAPFCSESNEGCWQQNRRGHFLIAAK